MNIIFMGTPEFSVPCLERLIADGHRVSLVVTQADKPKGRGQKLTPPPVKECALRYDIPVLQPATLRDAAVQETLRGYQPDLIVVVAYGKILPREVLEMPVHGCINVHASLLPRYRGAAPIQWAVLNGEAQSGVTTMCMDVGLDTGDMLLKEACEISPDMTAGELHDRLSVMGAELLSRTVQELQAGTLTRTPQNEAESCYASMLDKSLCAMDFTRTAQQLHNQVRGLSPWPVATVMHRGKKLKIHRTRVAGTCDAAAGVIVTEQPLTVACGEGTLLEICEVQAAGGKRMDATAYFRGHPVEAGTAFAD